MAGSMYSSNSRSGRSSAFRDGIFESSSNQAVSFSLNNAIPRTRSDLNADSTQQYGISSTMLSELLNDQKWEEVIPLLLTPRGKHELRQTMCMNGIDAWSRDTSNNSVAPSTTSTVSSSNNNYSNNINRQFGRGMHNNATGPTDDNHRGYALHHPFLYRLRAYGQNDNPKPIAPIYVVEALIGAYPEGVTLPDFPLRNLPLHRAASNPWDSESVDRVRVLLQAYPEGAMKANNNGELPLHLACQCLEHCSVHGMVTILLGAYPDGAKIKDNNGNLPIHTLCSNLFLPAEHDNPMRNSDCVAVFQSVVAAYPEGLNVPTEGGDLPIHLLCQHRMSSVIPQLVRVLTMTCPNTPIKEDLRGNLPIHLLTKNLYFHWQDYKEAQLEFINSMQESTSNNSERDEETEMIVDADNTHFSSSTSGSQITSSLKSHNGRIVSIQEAAVEVQKMVHFGEQTLLLLIDNHEKTLLIQSSLGFLPLNLVACLNRPSRHIWEFVIHRCPTIMLETDETGNSPLSSRVTTLAKYDKQWPHDPIVDLRHAILDPSDSLHFILQTTVRSLMSLSSSAFSSMPLVSSSTTSLNGTTASPQPELSPLIYQQPHRWMAQLIAYCGHMFHPEDMKLIFGVVFDIAPFPTRGMVNIDHDSSVFHSSVLMHILCGAPWLQPSKNNPHNVAPVQCIKDEENTDGAAQQLSRKENGTNLEEHQNVNGNEEENGEMKLSPFDTTMEDENGNNNNNQQPHQASSSPMALTGPDEYWSSSRDTPARTLMQAYLKNEPRFVAQRTVQMMNDGGELPLHCLLKTPQQWLSSGTITSCTSSAGTVATSSTCSSRDCNDGVRVDVSIQPFPSTKGRPKIDVLPGVVVHDRVENWPIYEDITYLLHQYPESIDVADGSNGLMPFMLPAMIGLSISWPPDPNISKSDNEKKQRSEAVTTNGSSCVPKRILKEQNQGANN